MSWLVRGLTLAPLGLLGAAAVASEVGGARAVVLVIGATAAVGTAVISLIVDSPRHRIQSATIGAGIVAVAVLAASLWPGAEPGRLGLDLHGADLSGARLSGAVLANANLSGAVLVRADLRGTDLRGACLRGANLTSARLEGALLDGADTTGAIAAPRLPPGTMPTNACNTR